MKIIKMGDLSPSQMTCGTCGCIFEYDNSDIKITHNVFGNDSYVECPCCHNIIYIYRHKGLSDTPWPTSPYGGPILTYANSTQASKNDLYVWS